MDTPTRPSGACLLHRPPTATGAWVPADPGYRTCSGCLDRLRDTLREIATRYAKLDPTPGANSEHGGRGAPGFGSRSPASEHVIVMTDRRSSPVARTWLGRDGRLHREPERPPLSVYAVLDTIAWSVAEARGIDGPHERADVPGLARWIDQQLDWLTRNETVAEVDAELRGLLAQLKPATGEPGRRHIGCCPNVLEEDDDTRVCGTRLYAPLKGDTIQCRSCPASWPRSEWLRLGDQLGEAS